MDVLKFPQRQVPFVLGERPSVRRLRQYLKSVPHATLLFMSTKDTQDVFEVLPWLTDLVQVVSTDHWDPVSLIELDLDEAPQLRFYLRGRLVATIHKYFDQPVIQQAQRMFLSVDPQDLGTPND